MTRTLIIGGARSGKSKHAEAIAQDSGKEVIYLATARAGDDEMQAHIPSTTTQSVVENDRSANFSGRRDFAVEQS
jgi:adenosylcobinamide kinase/adenosylcobinamide-phosphate guanylyltransferase